MAPGFANRHSRGNRHDKHVAHPCAFEVRIRSTAGCRHARRLWRWWRGRTVRATHDGRGALAGPCTRARNTATRAAAGAAQHGVAGLQQLRHSQREHLCGQWRGRVASHQRLCHPGQDPGPDRRPERAGRHAGLHQPDGRAEDHANDFADDAADVPGRGERTAMEGGWRAGRPATHCGIQSRRLGGTRRPAQQHVGLLGTTEPGPCGREHYQNLVPRRRYGAFGHAGAPARHRRWHHRQFLGGGIGKYARQGEP